MRSTTGHLTTFFTLYCRPAGKPALEKNRPLVPVGLSQPTTAFVVGNEHDAKRPGETAHRMQFATSITHSGRAIGTQRQVDQWDTLPVVLQAVTDPKGGSVADNTAP